MITDFSDPTSPMPSLDREDEIVFLPGEVPDYQPLTPSFAPEEEIIFMNMTAHLVALQLQFPTLLDDLSSNTIMPEIFAELSLIEQHYGLPIDVFEFKKNVEAMGFAFMF